MKEARKMPKIECNTFVKRQTKESPFSDFDGSWDELAKLAELYFNTKNMRVGYKFGVVLIDVARESDIAKFRSGVVTLTETTPLTVEFKARREGEIAFLNVLARGVKTAAKRVDIVLYSRALLVEEGEQVPNDVDYQIVSVNARTQDEPEPMTPTAMARNFLGLPGGTKAEYTAEQFAQAIVYWSTHAMHGGDR